MKNFRAVKCCSGCLHFWQHPDNDDEIACLLDYPGHNHDHTDVISEHNDWRNWCVNNKTVPWGLCDNYEEDKENEEWKRYKEKKLIKNN